MISEYLSLIFIIIIIIILILTIKNCFFVNFKFKNIKKKTDTKIPKILHLTYYSKKAVPSYVFDNINKYCSDYKIIFYDDNACINELKQIDNILVDKFKRLDRGAHKADLFRYCILYKYGGVYLDIKTDLKMPLNNFIDHTINNALYTVYTENTDKIYQGFIATYPQNDIFTLLVEDMLMHPVRPKYHFTIKKFYQLVINDIQSPMKIGFNKGNNNTNYILYLERNLPYAHEKRADRYGGYWKIFDKNNRLLFKTRYDTFPWK